MFDLHLPNGVRLPVALTRTVPVVGEPPVTKFGGSGGIAETVRRLADESAQANGMDRASLLAELRRLSFDVSTITDAVPDEFLRAVVLFVRGGAANDPAGNPAAGRNVSGYSDRSGNTGRVGAAGGLDPERRRRVLSGSAIGRTILGKEGVTRFPDGLRAGE